MSEPTPLFSDLRTVAIPVTDQDASKALFEQLGFQAQFDAELTEGFRWIELGLPGAAASISLVTTGDRLPIGIDTGIRLVAPDARAAHAELTDLGLDVGDLLDWDGVPLMFSFCDRDGNRLYVSEPG